MAHTAGVARGVLSSIAPLDSRFARAATRLDEEFPEVDGTSSDIQALKRDMRHAARDAFVTILIQGESGTGKERVAQAIHRASPRRHAPFVIVDCAGLSPTLVEDELFGHVRGAFTGAIAERPGPFERANGGTVFLDEVGELTPELQIKLLRALQQRTVRRLGCRHDTAFDVRVIAATNIDLVQAVTRRQFREDLYYRLNVYTLRVPPLRNRGAADIKALAARLLDQLMARRRERTPVALDPQVLELFVRYRWPGNVRELENVLERMLVAAGDDVVLAHAHLPSDLAATSARADTLTTAAVADRELPSLDAIRKLLERNGFNRQRTASQLGLSRHQLYRLISKNGDSSAAPHPKRSFQPL